MHKLERVHLFTTRIHHGYLTRCDKLYATDMLLYSVVFCSEN